MTTQRLIEKEKKPAVSMPKDPIMEVLCALTDPMIVFPSGWEDTLPERLKKDVPIQRLIHQMRCLRGEASWQEATDLEALVCLYPTSLQAPMGSYWTNIYLYLGTVYMGDRFPEDIREKELSQYEMGMLRDLKRWIYQKRVEHRKQKARAEMGAVQEPTPAAPVEAKYEQLSLM